MAPTPLAKLNSMAPTPSSKSNLHLPKTPLPKRLTFNAPKATPNPNSAVKETPAAEHPVEVIGRIRNFQCRKDKPQSALQINQDRHSLRVKTDIGYRDFSFDGVSLSEEEDLDGFYKKFVESRINGVKLGDKCTIMMYGPTGSGKSHTMFGCTNQPGIVYQSLRDILGVGDEETDGNEPLLGSAAFVHVTVLEIYNEEIYDLLSTNNGGGFSLGWSKGSASKVRLEVMGKKAKNATFIYGTDAGKISKEIQKVEKRRIVKSTLCNERSSRSHCMIILDVPTVGGRLMLVDMAGSENIEQAGQNGLDAKMQTAKINQGNIALKRVVDSIANGDSHVPFRDSKLTMLLQDSFEDDKSKILMILCASPDPKELHKTLSTLEYGAKAKCIVRGPDTSVKDKGAEGSSSTIILGSRIAAMDQFIYKLQLENKQREKESTEARKELMKKEEEISALKAKLALVEGKGSESSEEEINVKVNERSQMLKSELEKKIQECQKMAHEFVEMERRKMEEKMFQQQQEFEILRQRVEELESELGCSRNENGSADVVGSSFAQRLLEVYADEDPGMEKSMDLDKSMDLEIGKREIGVNKTDNSNIQTILDYPIGSSNEEEHHDAFIPNFPNKASLSTVFEEEEEEDNKEKPVDEEVQKEVIEEKKVCFTSPGFNFNLSRQDSQEAASSRTIRIQNIFTLCGNYRELSQSNRTPGPTEKMFESTDSPSSPVRTIEEDSAAKLLSIGPLQISLSGNLLANKPKHSESLTNKVGELNKMEMDSKENYNPLYDNVADTKVHVKWEASKENPGKLITTFNIAKNSTLADLRKLIEIYLGPGNQAFTFLVSRDSSGAPVSKEKEAIILICELPICNNQLQGHVACLRPVKGSSPLDNKLPLTPKTSFTKPTDGLSPELGEHLRSTPFITLRKQLPAMGV